MFGLGVLGLITSTEQNGALAIAANAQVSWSFGATDRRSTGLQRCSPPRGAVDAVHPSRRPARASATGTVDYRV
jgi:hypothetical protein